jgi:hypothetical protein
VREREREREKKRGAERKGEERKGEERRGRNLRGYCILFLFETKTASILACKFQAIRIQTS